MEKEQYCLECGKPIYGRPDKKFCSSNCKNGWHYQESAGYLRLKNWTISALSRNHHILLELMRRGEARCNLSELKMRGFTEGLVTSYIEDSGKDKRYACYDILYTQSPTEIYDISPLP